MKIRIDEKTIVICSIVRNAEKGLKRNIPVVNKLCRQFKDYRIVVFENDSDDRTKEILAEWQSKDPSNIHIFMENLGIRTIPKPSEVSCNPFFSLKRNEKMSAFRNKYLNYIEENNWNPDYLMVVDLDVSRVIYDGIITSFNTKEVWDAITAFGYSTSPSLRRRYHDVYILVEKGEELVPQTEYSIKEKANRFAKYYKTPNLIPVYSAFGGLAIYKYEKIKGLRYMAIPNNDNRVESRGEHFSIYKQMADRGYNEVYINPEMVLKYQNITWKIIINSVKRYLKL